MAHVGGTVGVIVYGYGSSPPDRWIVRDDRSFDAEAELRFALRAKRLTGHANRVDSEWGCGQVAAVSSEPLLIYARANDWLERYCEGLMPVHLRKARVNTLCWRPGAEKGPNTHRRTATATVPLLKLLSNHG